MRFVTAAGFIHLLVGYGVMFFSSVLYYIMCTSSDMNEFKENE